MTQGSDGAGGQSRSRWLALAAFLAAAIVGYVAAWVPPIPQDPAYHLFADRRVLLGIPNFANIVSNIPFLLVGVAALVKLPRLQPGIHVPASIVYAISLLLVGVGSAWYHYAPSNATLVWDRLPMAIGFMALFAIVLGDRVSPVLGRRLLWPLVMTGVATVLYWDWTELQGRGDLRPYGLVQFLPMVLIPLLLLTNPGRGLRGPWVWATLVAYILAKLMEEFDGAVFQAMGVASGHTIKHLLGALAATWALRAMQRPGS